MAAASGAWDGPPLAPHEVGVLLVEDDPLVLMDNVQALEEAGLVPFSARDSDEALALLSKRSDIRVMITDVDLQRGSLNGFQLARTAAAKRPGIGVLIVSGKNRPQPDDLPPQARFLVKPCQPRDLVSNVFAFVSRQTGSI